MRFSLLCNWNGCYVMEPQILEPVEDFPRKNAVEAGYALFPCTPLECVGGFLYPTTELSYSQSTFCPLPVISCTRRMCMENWVSTKIAYAPSGLLEAQGRRHSGRKILLFWRIMPKKCPVWRILRRNSSVLFLFPGTHSVLVGGSLGFWFWS